MNSTHTVIDFEPGEVVNYYTLLSVDSEDDVSETDDFFNRMELIEEHSDELERFIEWMYIVADELGVREDTFRGERACFALPPRKQVIGDSIFFRLYCYIVSPNVVILFNGDRKTEGVILPEDCPKVRPHFLRGQHWADRLGKAGIETKNKEIIGLEYIII